MARAKRKQYPKHDVTFEVRESEAPAFTRREECHGRRHKCPGENALQWTPTCAKRMAEKNGFLMSWVF